MGQRVYKNRRSRLMERYPLAAIDIVSILLAFIVAFVLRFKNGYESDISELSLYQYMCVMLMFCSILYSMFVEWNVGFFARKWKEELIEVVKYSFALLVLGSVFLFLTHNAYMFSRSVMLYFAMFNVVINYGLRLLYKSWELESIARNPDKSDRVMVITSSKYADTLMDKVMQNKSWHFKICSVAILDKNEVGKKYQDVTVIANKDNLYDIVRQQALDVVFIYLPEMDHVSAGEMINEFELMGITCSYCTEIPGLDKKNEVSSSFAGYSVISFSKQYRDYRLVAIKRAMDIVGGLVGLIITGIIMPFVAIAIRLESPGPVFFAQTRIGKNGRRFKIYKFRSMYIDAEERKKELADQNEVEGLMFKMENDPRVTKVGKFIRKFSIDELPQFYNILIGDMSLVGTRPPTCDEFSQYNNYYRRRLAITPGLTGMWQVSGRSNIDNFDEVVRLDLDYIDNWSIGLDIKILFETVGAVIKGRGSK